MQGPGRDTTSEGKLDGEMFSGVDQRAVVVCKSSKNSLSQPPITRLPTELVAEIFLLYIITVLDEYTQDVTNFYMTNQPRRSVSYLIVRLRQVCRRWREVVLHTPVLSSYIVVDHPEATREALQRSGHLPLHIFLPVSRTLTSATTHVASIDIILAQFSRVLHATVVLTDHEPIRARFRHLPENLDASSLQTMRIACLESIGVMGRSPLPPLFQDVVMPRLKTLECVGGGMNPNKSMLSLAPSLRRLVLKGFHRPTSVDSLLQCLRAVPQLEELTLYGVVHSAGFWFKFNGERRASTATLPNLRSLAIGGHHNLPPSITVLNHLTYPARCSVLLEFGGWDRDNAFATDSLVAKSSGRGTIGIPGPMPFVSIIVSRTSLSSRRCDIFSTFWSLNPPYVPALQLHATSTVLVAMSHVLTLFAATSPTTRVYLSCTPFDVVPWRDLRDELALVEDLAFKAREALGLYMFMGQQDLPSFPQLKVLRLDLSDCTAPLEHLETLADALEFRAKNGVRLQEVRMVIPPDEEAEEKYRLIAQTQVGEKFWMRLSTASGAVEQLLGADVR